MSYCRFSDGDVYMYPSVYGGIECCACIFMGGESIKFRTGEEALAHLKEHIKAGHRVPKYAIEMLEKEIKEGII